MEIGGEKSIHAQLWSGRQLLCQFFSLCDPLVTLNPAFELQAVIDPRHFGLGPFGNLIKVPEAQLIQDDFKLWPDAADHLEIIRTRFARGVHRARFRRAFGFLETLINL